MRRLAGVLMLLAGGAAATSGCGLVGGDRKLADRADVEHYRYAATQLAEPNLAEDPHDVAAIAEPASIGNTPREYWDLSLEQAVRTALAESKILRKLDGTLLRAPEAARTVFDPAIRETDPRFGVEAALSAFDANFATSAFFEGNDRALNNVFFGGGTRLLEQDAFVVQSQLTKRAVTGTQFTAGGAVDYDANNAPGNAFSGAYDLTPELLVRHPLLQGGGVNFNRIAGPSSVPGLGIGASVVPGLYNGVVVARVNTDVSLAEFEVGVRNFVSDVENAYWDLYFAYRELDARIRARDEALRVWRTVHAWYQAGRKGGDAASEAQAREQYYRFAEDVQNALSGRLVDGTQTNNGSSGGTFRPNGGVLVAERRLRLLMGVPVNDGRVIRPTEEPPTAEVVFDWPESLAESLSRRTELRRQRWLVKRRQMELEASHEFLEPRLDAIARYRWRGFGKDLIQQHDDETFELANGPGSARFNDALGNLASGDFQEWQLGFEFAVPLGFRQAHAAVRNAELQLARERAILHEQEREVAHDLGNAVAELQRAYDVLLTTFNRLHAGREQYQALKAVYDAAEEALTKEQLYVLLEAQRRWMEADVAYHRAAVEYALAIKNVHFEKGSLLQYDQIVLEEGLWPVKAYRDAAERFDLRSEPLSEHTIHRPYPLESGPSPQLIEGSGPVPLRRNGDEAEPATRPTMPDAPAPDRPRTDRADEADSAPRPVPAVPSGPAIEED